MNASPPHVRTAEPPWQQLILVCRKCTRKLGGGFGSSGHETLRAEIRRSLRHAGLKRRVRVVETGCLSICPKNAVSVLGMAHPGQVFVVPAGADRAILAATIAGAGRPHESFRSGETSR